MLKIVMLASVAVAMSVGGAEAQTYFNGVPVGSGRPGDGYRQVPPPPTPDVTGSIGTRPVNPYHEGRPGGFQGPRYGHRPNPYAFPPDGAPGGGPYVNGRPVIGSRTDTWAGTTTSVVPGLAPPRVCTTVTRPVYDAYGMLSYAQVQSCY